MQVSFKVHFKRNCMMHAFAKFTTFKKITTFTSYAGAFFTVTAWWEFSQFIEIIFRLSVIEMKKKKKKSKEVEVSLIMQKSILYSYRAATRVNILTSKFSKAICGQTIEFWKKT